MIWRLLAIALALGLPEAAAAGPVLDHVRATGTLTCGVDRVEADYSKAITHGDLTGLGADICRAVAASVLGKNGKLQIRSYPDEPHSLAALKAGETDLLVGATPSLSNTTVYGVGFAPPVLFDGQGFLVARGAGIASPKDLAGKQVCYISGTAADDALIAFMRREAIAYLPFPFEERGEMEAALVTGHCAAITGDISDLANMRSGFHARTANFLILPKLITLEPLAPAFRLGDSEWATAVAWTVEALILAEQRRVAGTESAAAPSDDAIPRLLAGAELGDGERLGLDDGWAERAVQAAGDYGEIFTRDVGDGSPLKLPRGANALWTQGGLMYAWPIR